MVAYSDDVDSTCMFAVDGWYDEVQYYRWGTEHPFEDNWNQDNAVGHFTQLVWKSTTSMGCGVAKGTYSGGRWSGSCKVVVCR